MKSSSYQPSDVKYPMWIQPSLRFGGVNENCPGHKRFHLAMLLESEKEEAANVLLNREFFPEILKIEMYVFIPDFH
jgi:hypothetical protein